MSRRVVVWGAIAAAVYLAAAAFTAGRFPLRPIFDGLAPPPNYNWVSPPPGYTNTQPPTGASQKLPITRSGTEETSVATTDGEATLILSAGAFPVHGKDKDVQVDIKPLDAGKFGKPPQRLAYAGNAYEVSAKYEPSGADPALALDATVLLAYGTNAGSTKILHRSGSSWTQVTATDVPASLQVFARTKQLGVFVAAGPAQSNSLRYWTLGIASGIAALLGTGFGLRERRRIGRK